jgi:hydroxyethylthiazole kinase-like uncharacterized protein yjeF
MSTNPAPLYTADQVREFDRIAIEDQGIDGYALMEQAGEAAFAALLSQWSQVRHLVVVCGAGNNGGDGYVMARLAHQHDIQVELLAVTPVDKLTGSAKMAADAAIEAGLTPANEIQWPQSGVVVDALLGTGLKGEVNAEKARVIQQINDSGLPVVAVDVPSGLDANTGCVLGCAVKAYMTVTMIGNKQGLFTGRGPIYAGEVRLAKLGVPNGVMEQQAPSSHLISWRQLFKDNPLTGRRELDCHKGQLGHVMILGGDFGYGGAVIMAAGAALRSGAGLVSVATRSEHLPALLAKYPEVMVHAVDGGQDVQPLLPKADVLVVGPGLGQNHWGQQILQQVFALNTPVILDADALNLLAVGRIQHNLKDRLSVMTPHPGEAGRLLETGSAAIQQDRFAAVKVLQDKFHSQVILKGLGTLIGYDQDISICTDGNPGMASGGMGDVLSGVLGAMVAIQQASECAEFSDAVLTAVCLHSAAADQAAGDGENGMVATDLLAMIRSLIN